MDDSSAPLFNQMRALGQRARKAARAVASASGAQRTAALKAMAFHLRARKDDILAANARR